VALSEFENTIEIFLAQVRSGERVPVVTDFYIPDENLGHFMNDLTVLENNLKLELALYGSYATGIYHLRPKFRLEDEDFNRKVLMLLRAGAFVIKRQDGVLAGGMPEGRLKALITNNELGKEEKKLYDEIKNMFDRYEIMNPGVKLGADAKFTVRHFRNS
jgi:FAD/FMN-containing dehydrogenase